jgi:hypothetical protein
MCTCVIVVIVADDHVTYFYRGLRCGHRRRYLPRINWACEVVGGDKQVLGLGD